MTDHAREPTGSPSKETIAALREEVAQAHAARHPGSEIARLFARGIDAIVASAFARALEAVPLPGCALVALGGLGRQELSPFSDVDLLLVVPEAARDEAERLAHALFTPLWDAGLEPGTALRTPAEALEIARADHTAATAMLDARFLAGDPVAVDRLLHGFWMELRGEALEAFVAAKAADLAERRARFGGSVYLLEPNIKNSPGGIRDLSTGLWMAHARHRVRGLDDVAAARLLPAQEVESLREAREGLLTIRCALHLFAGRRDDRLTFEAQEEIAKRLGYAGSAHALAVEQLMRDYYLAAQSIEHATDALIDRCAHEAKPGPSERRPIDDDFELIGDRVALRGSIALVDRPELVVELFVAAERERAPVLPSARDQVAHEVARLGEKLATMPAPMRAFLAYLESPGANGRALDGLHETGVLGGLFPEFARLKARVQHDAYHVFTVDTHTLFALQKLLRLRAGELDAEEPGFTRLAQDLADPLPLCLALLFHDLGKATGGGHAKKGETLVRDWGERAARAAGSPPFPRPAALLSPRSGPAGEPDSHPVDRTDQSDPTDRSDRRDAPPSQPPPGDFTAPVPLDPHTIGAAAFLVREHLTLSQIAFRRDLSDPALIQRVVDLAGTRERLDELYLLTYADISSVGPETWNDWRARLLAELYDKARARLDSDLPQVAQTRTEAALAGARALRQLVGADPELERFISLLPERHVATVPARAARAHFELWKRARGRLATGEVHPRPDAGNVSELVIVADDRPGLLADIAGVLAAHSIDILSAEIFSLTDGRALDSFLVREPGGLPASAERCARALLDLERLLAGEETVPELVARRRGASFVSAGPAVPTRVRFDLSAARDATVLDVFTRDRIGLLHDLAAAIHDAGASIVLARVATEGNKATDGFYLQDANGRKIADPAALERLRTAVEQALAT